MLPESPAGKDTIRVLIVDDTLMYRKILGDVLATIPDVEVVGKAANGVLALHKLETTPNVNLVLLDVFMPEMDGMETFEQIQKKFPHINVVMVSSEIDADAAIVIKALRKGALDFIPKPHNNDLQANITFLKGELQRIIQLVRIRTALRPTVTPAATTATVATAIPKAQEVVPSTLPPAQTPTAPKPPASPISVQAKHFDLVVIGVSTGGPNALGVLIPKLPKDLPCPVLIVQHMPPKFTYTLAQHLSTQSQLPVKEAGANDTLKPGTILIAPGGRHLAIRKDAVDIHKYAVALNDDPPVHSCRPSVDVMMESVAQQWQGKDILCIILTGMGDDGANGIAAIKQRGGYCIAQDAPSCVVYGMPKAVYDRGLADEVLPLSSIADRIARLCNV